MEEFETIFFRFGSDVEVMSVREKRSGDGSNVGWSMVPLLKIGIEGI